jgi:hypothetical protein
MDLALNLCNHKVQGIEPLTTPITGAECLVFCFCQQPNDVLSLVLHPMFESFDGAGCNYALQVVHSFTFGLLSSVAM